MAEANSADLVKVRDPFTPRTAADWLADLREWVDQVRADPRSIGVLSMGQQCAVALVLDDRLVKGEGFRLNDPRPKGYTWLDCVQRIEPELLVACIRLQRLLT